MPEVLTTEQIAAIGNPIADGLLPGWTVTWIPSAPEDMPIPDALAVCRPPTPDHPGDTTPTRRLATVWVLADWPPKEDLAETIRHELTHAWISPLVALIPESNAAVMIEEQLVEQMAKYLGTLAPRARKSLMHRIERVVSTFAPQTMRARFGAHRARVGGPMDPETIQKMIDALKAGDGESALKMCEEALVKAASASPAGEPDGDELAGKLPMAGGEPPMNDPKAEKPAAGASPAAATPPEPAGRVAARMVALDHEHARARKAANATTSIAVRARLRELRADGVALPTSLEADLGKMTDLDAFEQRVADITAGRSLALPGGARARLQPAGGHSATPPPVDFGAHPVVTAEQLRAEHADEGFIAMYEMVSKSDPAGAAGLIAGFREPSAAAGRARLASKGPAGRAHARPS